MASVHRPVGFFVYTITKRSLTTAGPNRWVACVKTLHLKPAATHRQKRENNLTSQHKILQCLQEKCSNRHVVRLNTVLT